MMTSMWKRSLSMFLAFVMVFGMVPVNAFALEEEIVEEILVEEVFEEELVEEVFEEEFVEEVLEEELVEEVFEEEYVEEEPQEEEVISFHTSDSVANTSVASEGDADASEESEEEEETVEKAEGPYYIWVNRNKMETEIRTMLFEGTVKTKVLEAIDYTGDATVSYDGQDVTGAGLEYMVGYGGIENTYQAFAAVKGADLANEVSNSNNTAYFTVTDASGSVDYPITFRDNRIQVTVTFNNTTISNKGEPEGLNLASYVTVKGKNPETNVEETITTTDYTVNVESYTWPKADSADVTVTVTMTDADKYDLDNGSEWSQKYKLIDTRKYFTVTYMEDSENLYVAYNQLEGSDMEIPPSEPTKDNYTFTGWLAADGKTYTTEDLGGETVSDHVTYTAAWAPDEDVNKNGKADQEETYTVYLMKGEAYTGGTTLPWYTSYTLKYGDTIPDYTPTWSKKNFAGWSPDIPLDRKVKAPKPITFEPEEGDETDYETTWFYYAQWSEHPVVYFQAPGTSAIAMNVEVSTDAYMLSKPDADNWDGYYVTGWRYYNADKELVEFNFAKSVQDQLAEGQTTLTLIPDCFDDKNGDGDKDGTKDDPYYYYYWVLKTTTDYENDYYRYKKDMTAIDPDTVDASDEAPEGMMFTGWSDAETSALKSDGSLYYYDVVFTAQFADDLNDNGQPDDEEMAYITVVGDGEVTLSGDYAVKVEPDSEVITYIYDSTADNITVVANPADGAYVKSIVLGNAPQEIAYDETYTGTAVIPQTAYNGDGTGVSITVTFGAAAFTDGTMKLKAKTNGYTNKQVYAAIATAPAYNDNTKLAYLARAEGTVEVDVSALREFVETEYPGFYDMFMVEYAKFADPDTDIYTHTYEEHWEEDLNAKVSTDTAQQVADTYINEIVDMTQTELMAAYSTLTSELKAAINETGMHAFGTQETEKVSVEYTSDAMHLEKIATLTIEDPREDAIITAGDLTFTYGAFNKEDILNKISCNSDAAITLESDVDGLSAGSYKIWVSVKGTEDFKAAKASFDLTVNPAKAAIAFEKDLVVADPDEMNYSEVTPVVTRDDGTVITDIDLVRVVAGVNIRTVDATLGEEESVTEIGAVANIVLPEMIWEALEEYNTTSDATIELESREYTLSEIKGILADPSITAIMDVSAINTYLDKLISLSAKADAEDMPIDVKFLDDSAENADMFSSDMGIYLNVAMSIDSNYAVEEEAYNTILIFTGAAIPNDGLNLAIEGLEAVKGGVFNVDVDIDPETGATIIDELKNLKVVDDEGNVVNATHYFYGVTTDGEIVMNEEPTKPGLYVITTSFENDGEWKHDAAILTANLRETTVDIKSGIYTVNGAQPVTVAEEETNGLMPTVDTGEENVGITLISAGVDLSTNEIVVNVDVADEVNNLLAKLNKLTSVGGIELKLPEDGTLDSVAEELTALTTNIHSKLAKGTEILAHMGVPGTEYIDEYLGKASGAIDEIESVIDKYRDLFGNVKVTFGAHKGYTAPGVYAYAAVITDPLYKPDADFAYMIIEDEQYVLNNTTKLEEHDYMEDLTGSSTGNGSVFVVTGNGNISLVGLNAKVGSLSALLNKYLGKEIEVETAYNVSELVDTADGLADSIISAIVGAQVEIPTEIAGHKVPEKIVNFAQEVISAEILTGIKDDVKDIVGEKVDEDLTFTITEEMPTEPGTYTVRGVSSYGAYDSASLKIKPAYARYAGVTYETPEDAFEAALASESEDKTVTLNRTQENVTITVPTGITLNTNSCVTGSSTIIVSTGATVTVTNKPAGVTIKPASGTVIENKDDDTYTGVESEYKGSIRLRAATLNLLDKVCIIYKAHDDHIIADEATVAERGVLLYKSAELLATKDPEQAYETVKLEWNASEQRYIGMTEGIDARDMGTSQFAVAYMKMTDGSYIFGTKEGNEHSFEYSPLIYCRNKMKDEEIGTLCAAIMHYGAAAQVEQYGMTENLMNAEFDLVSYGSDVLGESVFSANTSATNGMTLKSVTMDLKGAISYIVKYTADDTLSGKQLYAEYTLLGKTGSVKLETGSDGRLWAVIEGVYPKDLDSKLTVKPYYLDENGNKVYGGELNYSGYEYVRRAQSNENYTDKVKALARALAMYVYYADIYANKNA